MSLATGDLIEQFAGFDAIWEVGVSGLQSSYYVDTKANQSVSGPTTGYWLPELGPDRVTYPYGIGQVPSPGGAVGRVFDEAVLGLKIEGDNLILQLAGGLNPLTGYYDDGWKTWYGQGDLFLDVADNAGVRHYALLNAWGRLPDGTPITLNGGHFNAARSFHLTGGPERGSLEGHLIRLGSDSHVTIAGGTGAYTPSIAPQGLDLRVFAAGGLDLGPANLTHISLTDFGQTWYIQRWTVSLTDLATQGGFELTLHASPSCGNDQIGGRFEIVPEPSSILLAVGGAAVGLAFRRRV